MPLKDDELLPNLIITDLSGHAPKQFNISILEDDLFPTLIWESSPSRTPLQPQSQWKQTDLCYRLTFFLSQENHCCGTPGKRWKLMNSIGASLSDYVSIYQTLYLTKSLMKYIRYNFNNNDNNIYI